MNAIKKLIAIIMALFSFCATGCAEDNATVRLKESLNQAKAERNEAMREFNDLDFFLSADREAHLVGATVVKRRWFNVILICSTPDKIVGAVAMENGHLSYINDSWRELVAESIMTKATKDESLLANKKGGVMVTGAIVSWSASNKRYSLCDADGDGSWDFASSDGYILLSDEKSKLDRIVFTDKYGHEVCISSPGEIFGIAEVSDKDDITFKDVEKRLG